MLGKNVFSSEGNAVKCCLVFLRSQNCQSCHLLFACSKTLVLNFVWMLSILLRGNLCYVKFWLLCSFLLTDWINCTLWWILSCFILLYLIFLWFLVKIMPWLGEGVERKGERDHNSSKTATSHNRECEILLKKKKPIIS